MSNKTVWTSAVLLFILSMFFVFMLGCGGKAFTRIEADKIVTQFFTADKAKIWIAPGVVDSTGLAVPSGFFVPLAEISK